MHSCSGYNKTGIDGFLVPKASLTHIDEYTRSSLMKFIRFIIADLCFVDSIYLRGSLATGNYISQPKDVDVVVCLSKFYSNIDFEKHPYNQKIQFKENTIPLDLLIISKKKL